MTISIPWIKPFELNNTGSRHQPITGKGFTETTFKAVKAALRAIAEMLQNSFLRIANIGISLANKVHDCIAGKKFAPLPQPNPIAIPISPPQPSLELEIDGLIEIRKWGSIDRELCQSLTFQTQKQANQFVALFEKDNSWILHSGKKERVVFISFNGRTGKNTVLVTGFESAIPNQDVLTNWLKAALNEKRKELA